MAEAKRGIGRGLSAILAVAPAVGEAELRQIPLELIAANPNQPRTVFDDEPLVALADSLRERGVLQPVLLRPVLGGTYEIIAGERRWRAAKLAGLDTIPALVRAHDDAESLEIALIENMAREDLNPIEEARAIAALVGDLGLTREEIGRRVGRSRAAISNQLRLLELPDEALAWIEDGTLSAGHGRALLTAEGHDRRRMLARAAAREGWTVRETEARARTVSEAPRDDGAKAAKPAPHPDQVAAARELADAFSRGLGGDVRVSPRSGGSYGVTIEFDSFDAALEATGRLGERVSI